MIKANELRIGNVVYCGSIKGVVTEICASGISFDYLDKNAIVQHCGWPNIKPIPLTEEILLKCGFEKWVTIYNGVEEIIEGYFVHKSLFKDYRFYLPYYIMNLYSGSIVIQYLHQLQNFYFALTNEELKIELL